MEFLNEQHSTLAKNYMNGIYFAGGPLKVIIYIILNI